jgi:protein-S-isoprenylcysteine O-methyltransferase Ste14
VLTAAIAAYALNFGPNSAPHFERQAAFYAVIACWFLFAAVFIFKKRTPRTREAKRDRTAVAGIALEAVGIFMVWFQPLQRTQFAPGPEALGWGIAVLSVVFAAGSVALVNAACRHLGKQWAVSARLVEGHTLIQDGPYRFVRNPIYLGMFGMLLATGLLLSQWIPLLIASLLFILGTCIRIRTEERLLRGAFGPEFEAYARRVPAFIPGIY